MKDDQIAILREARRNPYRDGGWKIYDIADRTKPRLVHYERTPGSARTASTSTPTTPTSRPRWTGMSETSWSSTISRIRRSRTRCRVGGCPASTSPAARPRPGAATAIACTMPCASATSCGRRSGRPASGSSTWPTSGSRRRPPPTTITRRRRSRPTPSCRPRSRSADGASPSASTRSTSTCAVRCMRICGSSTSAT